MLAYSSTPIQEIVDPLLTQKGVRLLIKREDLNHPLVSGNKWWKLRHNLQEAKRQGHSTLLTFGGAYSNHIYATAAAASENGFHAIGIIRGEETFPLNNTLLFAKEQGMKINYVSRERYKQKETQRFIEELHLQHGDFYLIPEGGTNSLAVKGCLEFAAQELNDIDFDHLFLPVGTGGTMAGVIAGVKGKKKITGVSVLKDGAFLNESVRHLLHPYRHNVSNDWNILTHYHEGGYGKKTDRLMKILDQMKFDHDLPLDHVYTGKMMLAILSELAEGKIKQGTTVLAVHTGGLQGMI